MDDKLSGRGKQVSVIRNVCSSISWKKLMGWRNQKTDSNSDSNLANPSIKQKF
jgi:hypothetical protein